VSRRWRNWCQNKVYEETKGADSRDKVKHNGRSDQLLIFREHDEGGRARVTTDEERVLRGR